MAAFSVFLFVKCLCAVLFAACGATDILLLLGSRVAALCLIVVLEFTPLFGLIHQLVQRSDFTILIVSTNIALLLMTVLSILSFDVDRLLANLWMNMIGLVRNEWKKVFLPVLLTTVLLAIAMSVLSCTIYQNYTLHYDLEAWEVGTELFSLLYPLFVVVPLCWNLYYERKNNFLLYVMPRVKIKKYLTAKWIAYALGTLCIIVIPYILSAVFALYVKPPVVPFVENPFSHIFENAFIKTPLLYAVALSLWRGIVSLFVMTFGFILALYCKNIFVILTGPFMYSILENFVLAILCLERLRLVVAFDPTTVNPEVVSIFSFFFGPIVLSIVIGLTAFLLSKKNAVVTI